MTNDERPTTNVRRWSFVVGHPTKKPLRHNQDEGASWCHLDSFAAGSGKPLMRDNGRDRPPFVGGGSGAEFGAALPLTCTNRQLSEG